MTDKNRPPLPADQLTGLRVAGWHLVHEDERHQEAHRLAAEVARADRAEDRVRLAGYAFACLAEVAAEALSFHADGWDVEYLVARVERLRRQLTHEAAFFSEMPEVER